MSKSNTNNKVEQKPKAPLDLSNTKELISLIYNSKNLEDLKPLLAEHIKKIIKASKLSKYKIIFLYDPEGSIGDYSAQKIYQSISDGDKKDVLLVLVSNGGSVEPAYKISKNCKEYSPAKFVVGIPSKAKSAATLIALGADEIHMGSMSELGPIDPQIGGLPALGVMNALEYLASLCEKYPKSSDMLAKYITSKLDLGELGYSQRISESAVHYAEKLLGSKTFPSSKTANSVARSLVNDYKDHSFVIDKDEAKKYLGDCIKTNTIEYKFVNDLNKFLELVKLYVGYFKKKDFSIVGSYDNIIFLDR